MTSPSADTTVTDTAAAVTPDASDPSVSAAAATSESPEITAPSSSELADAGALTGSDLAAHLGADDLEAHAAAQVAQGVPDGTEAPAGSPATDPHISALTAWLANPVYHPAMNVGSAAFSTCGLCDVVVGANHDWHTEAHRRGGG